MTGSPRQDPRSGTWLAAILLIGFTLRICGLTFGLPYLSNFYIRPDETLVVVPAIRLFERMGNPGFFGYPALMTEICAVLFKLFFSIARLLNLVTVDNMTLHFVQDSSVYFVISRIISATAGTITALFVYGIAARICQRKFAILAAFLYVIAPLAVRDAHFGVTDTLLTLFTTISVYFALLSVEKQKQEKGGIFLHLYLAAFFFGLAVSTKYTALLLAPALSYAAYKQCSQMPLSQTMPRLAFMCIVPASVFALFNPYALIHIRETVGSLFWLLSVFYAHQSADTTWTVLAAVRQVLQPLIWGPGQVPGLIFCLIGMAWPGRHLLKTPANRLIGLALMSFLFALFMFRHQIPYRYTLPVLPILAALAAKGAGDVGGRIRSPLIAVLICLLMVVPSAWTSIRLDILLLRQDTRTLAGEWIEKNIDRSVPICIFGGPEAEPQILETNQSIRRRITYVKSLYGKQGGDLVSELYRLHLLYRQGQGREAYEVFRNPRAGEVSAKEILLVIPSYPLRMVEFDRKQLDAYAGKAIRTMSFESMTGRNANFKLDAIDAFFLPFNCLEQVQRPGPSLRLMHTRKDVPKGKQEDPTKQIKKR